MPQTGARDVWIEGPGTRELQRIGRLMAGTDELSRAMRNGFRKEMREAGGDVVKDIRKSARSIGRRGGLGRKLATGVTVRTTFARNVGVRIIARNKFSVEQINDQGRIRHPLFGNRGHWYQQQGGKDWFDGPIEGHEDELRGRVLKVIDKVIRQAEGR